MDIYFSTETNYKNRLSKASRKIKSRNDLSIRYSEQNVWWFIFCKIWPLDILLFGYANIFINIHYIVFILLFSGIYENCKI